MKVHCDQDLVMCFVLCIYDKSNASANSARKKKKEKRHGWHVTIRIELRIKYTKKCIGIQAKIRVRRTRESAVNGASRFRSPEGNAGIIRDKKGSNVDESEREKEID